MTGGRRGVLLLAPAGVYLVVVVGGSLLLALYLSSTDAVAGSLSGRFVGPDNFVRAWGDPAVRVALRNTVVVAFTAQTLATVLGLVLAAVLIRSFRGRTLFLFLILLPWAAPVALGTLGWKWILDSLFSVLNWALRAVHLLGAGARLPAAAWPRPAPTWSSGRSPRPLPSPSAGCSSRP